MSVLPSSAHAGRLLVAAVSGCAVTVLEFAAVRQLAPAFGQSSYVWATVVAVVLAALSAGYALGGRLADRSTSARPLAIAYGLAAAWIAVAATYGPLLGEALTPTGLPGGGGLPLAFTGSLAASALLFAAPTFVLGMTSPFLIRLGEEPGRAGRTTGAIYAAGTLGSVVGCYLAPLELLQFAGTRDTLLLAAAALLALAVACFLAPWRRAAETAAPPVPGSSRWAHLAIAASAGLVVAVVEFGSVRFMAPWFGQSNFVWANVIGVILLSLALGTWLGGRLADRWPGTGPLLVALALAAPWLAAAALFGGALEDWLLPPGIDSAHLLPVAFPASLAATLILFGLPALLLATIVPCLVRMDERTGRAGRAAGGIFAASTAGSLLGCLLTPAVLVPGLGSKRALLLSAGATLLLALWVLLLSDRRRGWHGALAALEGAGVLAIVVLVVLAGPGLVSLRDGAGQLAEVESAYQTIRVIEKFDDETLSLEPGLDPAWSGSGVKRRIRFLRHDEDAETYQSVWLPDNPKDFLTGGRYFEHMALGARFAAPTGSPARLRVLIVGYAGGTVYRTLRDTLPEGMSLSVLGVEIDPAVVDVARTWLNHGELDGPDLELITGEDARTVVNALPADRTFDLVLVDAYTRTNYIPFQVASLEFFRRLKAHLAPGGWIGVNVMGKGLGGPVAKSVATTMTAAVGGTYLVPNVWFPGNVILWASPESTTGPHIRVAGPIHPLLRVAEWGLERLAVRHVPERDGGVLLTDDRSPSDRLADEELGL